MVTPMGKNKASKPTRVQKALMDKEGLKPENWLVLQDAPEELKVVSRGSGRTRIIKKDPVAATTKVSR